MISQVGAGLGVHSFGRVQPRVGLTFAEALRSRHFWLITLGLGLVGIVVVGLHVHLVPMMSDRGLEPARAAALLLTVFGLAS